MTANKAGICGRPGCTEPRHQSKTGKYGAYCRAHMNEQGRKANRAKQAAGKLPVTPNPYVRVIARRCQQCGEKYPSVRPYFDTSRDTDKRLNMICMVCDGTASTHIHLPQPTTPLYAWEVQP